MLFLGGGGSAEDERRLWVEAFPDGSRILVLPFAQSGIHARQDTVAWFVSAVARIGRFEIVDGTAAEREGARVLDGVDVVAIPGGNTFFLLHELRRVGLADALVGFVARGGYVYGGSAGAALMGADIDIAAIADTNDVGLVDTSGLDLVGGADVLPHYSATQRAFARERARTRSRSVICIPEDAGIVVARGRARNVGAGAVTVTTPSGEVERAPGDSWSVTEA